MIRKIVTKLRNGKKIRGYKVTVKGVTWKTLSKSEAKKFQKIMREKTRRK